MALTHEETIELTDTYKLMTAEELRGQLGDDPDHDSLINGILGEGKATELPDGPANAPDEEEEVVQDDDIDHDDEDEEEDEEAEEAAPQVVEEVAAPAAEEAAAAEPEPAVNVPRLDLSGLAEKYDQKLIELDAANATSLKALMDGELSPEDYAAQQAKYLTARDTLRDDKAFETKWQTEVHNFRATASRDGVDYFNNQDHVDALDSWVKQLANNPRHNDKEPAWFLKEAHKKVMIEYDIAAPTAKTAAKPAETPVSAKKVSQKTGRTPNLSGIPPTLSGLPAAAPAASGDGGEFDHIYKLDGIKFERAIASMGAEQRARFESEQ